MLFSALPFDAHRNARCVAFGCCFEKFQQVAIGVNALWLRAHILFECRQHPLLQSRHVDVHPIVIPIEGFGIPREKLTFIFANAFEQRPHIVRAKNVSILNGEGKKHFKSFLRFARLLFDAINGFLHTIDDAFIFSTTPTWLCFVEK